MNFGGSVRVNPCGLALLAVLALLLLYQWGAPSSSSSSSSSPAEPVSLKQLLSVAIEVARRGGKVVAAVRNEIDIGEKSKGKTKEGANNPVTNGDMLSHRAMYYGILKAFPGLSVVSEEHDPAPVDMGRVEMPPLTDPEVDRIVGEDALVPAGEIDVWIDPLDATQEYTENLLEYVTTMVCVAVKGRPVIGVIHKPFEKAASSDGRGQTHWAWAGPDLVDASLHDIVERTHPDRHVEDLGASRLIVSRSHAGNVHDVAERVFGAGAAVTPAGGAGFKALEVARGRQDAYVHVTLIKKWDICAGDALMRTLGGRLTTLDGEDVDYGSRLEEKNEGGVLAAVHDHGAYVGKLKDVLEVKKKPKKN